MAEFRRDIYTRLSAWAEATEHKPIVLCGARQVGKTHVLKVLVGTSSSHFLMSTCSMAVQRLR